ncbi:MAG: YeeE/YedE thiosulfate transporter family protein [Xanthobacteraceae bacterium]
MTNFTPISAAIGGALIGLSAVLLMLFNGRIAGITGIAAGLLDPASRDRSSHATFIIGLIAAPLSAMLLGYAVPTPQMPSGLVITAVAGLLVGFGTRLGNGCTSGHGVCGIARLSPRSIAATMIFMTTAIAVVALMRHGFGG